jgi:glycosyltransferase involved in cell wall biosynthesis
MTKRRTKVLFAGHSPEQGGAELCLDTLLRHLDQTRYEATVIFPWEGPMAQSARALGLAVEIVPLTWWMNWPHSRYQYQNLLLRSGPTVVRLARYLRRQRFDLVYTNTISIFESALAAWLAGVPHIWHNHEVLRAGSWMHQVLPLALHKKLIYGLSERVIFESHSSREVCEAGRPHPKSRVVYNSVRLCGTDLPPEADRERYGFHPDDLVVGFIGQFNDRKNPLHLLRAASVLKDPSHIKFLFVGDGPLRGPLLEQIAALGLSERCRILGFQDDVRWVLRTLDVLVLPSRAESFGLVLVEAGEFGKPVIATRTEGPREIVADGETGFLVDPDDVGQLAQKIELVLKGDIDRQQMGLAGRRRVRELFSAERNTRLTEQIIDEVLAGSPAGPSARSQAPSKNGQVTAGRSERILSARL